MKKEVKESVNAKSLRQRALELMHQDPRNISELSKDEIAELAHELGVYQIELEMQNDELRKAQVELENSRRRYSDLYDFAPLGYFILDKDGVILDVNFAGTILLGVEKSRMVGRNFSNCVIREDLAKYYLFRRKTLEDATRQACELQLKVKTGIIHVSLQAKATKDALTGEILYRIAVDDITERKRMEDVLRASESRYRQLFQSLKEGFFLGEAVFDDHGKCCDAVYLDVNPAFEQMMGMSRNQIVGKRARELIPEIKPEWLEVFGKVVRIGEAVSHQSYSEMFKKYFEALVFQPEPGRFGMLVNDITERKKVEDALKASEAQFRSLSDNSPDCIALHDSQLRHLYVNPSIARIVGQPQEAFTGRTIHEMNMFSGSAKELEQFLRNTLETGCEYLADFSYRAQDGTRFFQWRSVPIRAENGDVQKILAIATDITGRKKAEEELRKLTEELTRSNADLEQYASVANHDLREPLRNITSFLNLLERRYKDRLDEDAMAFINFAVDGARRMDNLLVGMLEYSRIHSHGKVLKRIAVQTALDDAVANLRKTISETRTEISSEPLPAVNADRTQLTQLFQNLIHNAIKFRSGEGMKIQIGCKPDKNCHVFSVTDNGIGIEPQYHEHIFTIFRRVNPKDERSGHGVGLAVCKKIVERHGGRIWLESECGKGTTFFFTIPC